MQEKSLKRDIIISSLRKRIQDGSYPAGGVLPGELILKKEFSVARETLRGALSVLEREGFLERIHGKGTFVRYSSKKQNPGKILIIADINGHPALTCHALIPRFEEHARAHGTGIDLCDYHWIKKLGAVNTAVLLEQRSVTGIILIASNFNGGEEILECLRNLTIPIILTGASPQDYRTTHLAICSSAPIKTGWSMAVTHLRDQGHRIVATMAVPEGNFLRGYYREEYLELLSRLGLSTAEELFPQDPRVQPYNPRLEEFIQREVDRLLALPKPPTAILCHSDYWVDPVYRTIRKHGLKIGEDVAVMGFVSGFNCDYITPTLSSIEYDFNQLAEAALRLLETAPRWMKQGHPYPCVNIPLKLVVRESTSLKYNPEKG